MSSREVMEPNYEQDGTRGKERRRDGKGEAQGKEGGTERQEKKGAKVEDEGSEKGNTCKEVDGQSTAGFLEDPRLPRGFSRLLIFADKRTSFQEPGGIIRGGRTRSLTQDEKPRLTTGPLFPRNVRTCRIMARGEKVEESSSSRAAAPGPEIIQSSSPVPTCSAAPSLPPAVFSLRRAILRTRVSPGLLNRLAAGLEKRNLCPGWLVLCTEM